jgi:DNA-binding MarR family transcriptional regulator
MSLEKDIQQRKFTNEYQKALVNIIYTHNWLAEQVKQIFSSEDLTAQQFNILRILRGAPEGLSTMQIRERMLDRMSDTSRLVDRLLKKGLVKKIANKLDKRLVCVTITPRGLTLLKKLDAREPEMQQFLKNLNEADAKVLNKLLDKIREQPGVAD